MAARTLLATRRAAATGQMIEDMAVIGQTLNVELPEEPRGRFPDALHQQTAHVEWISRVLRSIREQIAPDSLPEKKDKGPRRYKAHDREVDQREPVVEEAEEGDEELEEEENGGVGRIVPPGTVTEEDLVQEVEGEDRLSPEERAQKEKARQEAPDGGPDGEGEEEETDEEVSERAEADAEPTFAGHPLSFFRGKSEEEIYKVRGVSKKNAKKIAKALAEEDERNKRAED